jgi:hypothetical protein
LQVVKPRPLQAASIPGLLGIFQNVRGPVIFSELILEYLNEVLSTFLCFIKCGVIEVGKSKKSMCQGMA